ncbi:hypothetical protein CE143_03140 [Photorhabdus luminescens]|uniref:Uncharacterized protein n=1 Tax=Photorhabdus akhurstii TaxID=171438 RepID=A0ABX8LNV2_9GAMM|nr:hypothetical protein [Photorhabdus akhurstii]QXF32277.1 hypothetical protein B0X70_03155 [Photorhabdus akhurstii]UJD74068.1 hypothetical protein CE143_03140 [Photorhabdus luminescens]
MRWSETLKEKLFDIAYEKLELFKRLDGVIDEHAEILEDIRQDLKHDEATAIAIMFELAKMGFLYQRSRDKARKVALPMKDKTASKDDFTLCVSYKTLTKRDKEAFLEANQLFGAGWLVNDVVAHFSQQLNRSKRNIIQELYRQKLIILLDGEYQPYGMVHQLEQSSLANYLANKRAPQHLKDDINVLRSQLSELYNVYQNNHPTLVFSNDGTGFGKSYGVLNRYIESVTVNAKDSDFTNFLFVTPQKSQIDFDKKLIKKAKKKGIEFLGLYSQEDLRDLNFVNWVEDCNGEIIENKKRYLTWEKRAKNSPLASKANNLAVIVKTIENIEKQILIQKQQGDDADLIQDHEDQLKKCKSNLTRVLDELSEAALNRQESAINLPAIMGAENKIELLRKEIIFHCIPMAAAMVSPCILLATTSKFDRPIKMPRINKLGKYIVKSIPFDYLIGGKKKLTDNTLSAFLESPVAEQIEYLKTEFFKIDDENYFRKHNISFTLVIDEEHEAYRIFSNSRSVNLIDDKVQLVHVFAVTYRLLQQVKDIDVTKMSYLPFLSEKNEFIHDIKAYLEKNCELSLEGTIEQNLESLLKLFSGNIDFVQIKGDDIEQVINITRNVFSFSPKRFFNEESLKKVKIEFVHRGSGCQLYYSTDNRDKNPSLHDTYQLAMVVLAAAAKISSRSQFAKSLKQAGDSSQNFLMYKFIQKAGKIRNELKQMFEHPASEEMLISHFYTYFQSKTVFTIERMKELEFQDETLSHLTYINFTLDLIKEQPEVALLRSLYNTRNSVICLSATTGFAETYSGQYNRNFLRRFCAGKPNNLAIQIIERSGTDIALLASLRDKRAELRTIDFGVFNSDLPLFDFCKDFDESFKIKFNFLRDELYGLDKNFKKSLNNYQKIEFERQLCSMLLAAYQGKHTMSLALSNRFQRKLKKYFSRTEVKIKNIKKVHNSWKIFEYLPFANKPKIRVILFDAELRKECNIRDFIHIKDKNTKIVLLSSYKSAGTGLNYFLTYPEEGGDLFEEDFERLVLTSTPFWSAIIKDEKTNDRTLHSLQNYLLLMKQCSDSDEEKFLKDFDINLSSGEDYQFLMREHRISKLKDLMQAIGRVERKDTKINTEIFIPDSAVEDGIVLFNQFTRIKRNRPILESMSLLNHHFMRLCEKERMMCSFKSCEERELFEEKIARNSALLKEFFEDFVPEVLSVARKDNAEAIIFNEHLRSIESLISPSSYVKKLKSNPHVKKYQAMMEAVDALYIDISTTPQLKLSIKNLEDGIVTLTDIEHGYSIYHPKEWIFSGIGNRVDGRKDEHVTHLLKEIAILSKNVFKDCIPHPFFIPLLKGNIGEYLFTLLLDRQHNCQPIDPKLLSEKIGKKAYELFDFYIEADKHLICVDTKNWSSTLDKRYQSLKTHNNAQGKAETILSYIDNKYESVKFVYLNTRMENNPLNLEQEISPDSKIYYLNLFKEYFGYENKKQDYDQDFRIGPGSKLVKEVRINKQILNLLQGD